ncbi:MAG TPA: HAD hydrolase family protein [Phycisphaerales bacterium]|nr:HAD hydrolase family protein [Phycisphaerales bacterium]
MPQYFAVISDIDGCLGPESSAPVDADALARVAEWNRAAWSGDRPALTVCSGRPQPYAEAICRIIANDLLPCVCEMGVWLYDPRDNRYIMDPAITAADKGAVIDMMRWADAELLPRGVVYQPGKSASMSLWHPDTPFLMSLKPEIEQRIEREGWPIRVSNTVAWINCDLKHVSKATGLQRLMRMCGLEKERLIGIGDTLGDMAIRENVAFFACPSNAVPELKKVADYVSPLPEIEGVLDILGRILKFGVSDS